MAGSISQFISSFNTDVARPAKFDVIINVPLSLIPYVNSSRQMNFRCESTEMPGRTLSTTERKIGSAPVQKVPYHVSYNELDMTFIVSDDMSEKIFFEGWMEAINPSSTYNFNYKSNYVTDIQINQYDVGNNLTYQALLIDAFPIAVNQLDLNWSSNDYHRLTVVMAYTSWQNVQVSNILNNLGTQAISGLESTLSSLNTKL